MVVYVVGDGALHATVHMWKPEDKLVELVFPFHLHIRCEDVTQVAKDERQVLCLPDLLNHLGGLAVRKCFCQKDKHTKVSR